MIDHHCPGEWITVAPMKKAIRLLTREERYTIPVQDLSISLTAIPSLPKSGFVLTGVAPAQ